MISVDTECKPGHKGGYEHEHHGHTVTEEIICHLPYAIFSVAFGLAILSFFAYSSIVVSTDTCELSRGCHLLFHSFHFMHVAFAATGTMITFLRFSKNVVKALISGAISTIVFCTLSDSVLPYIGGKLLGVNMYLHVCFFTELSNVLPFLFVGLLNGYVMSRHHASRQGFYSIFSHFVHILISSFAAIFYLVSHGFTTWYLSIGPVFLFLVVAVVVPCTLSDVVVPMTFARAGKTHEKH